MDGDFPGMKIDLGSVGEHETFSYQGSFAVPTEGGEEASCEAQVEGSVVKTGSRLVLEADVDATIHVECSRCLESFNLPVKAVFSLVFHRGDRARIPDDVEEEDFIFLTEANESDFDIYPRVREAIILELPIKYLCREDCKGLCGRCGANLNKGGCDCGRKAEDPRWAPLKDLLNGKKDR